MRILREPSMQRSRRVIRMSTLAVGAIGWQLAVAWPVGAALESGVYQTVPGAMVEERNLRSPGGIRTVPMTATLLFDLAATPPSLTAFISDAVLEGGEPFALTVRSDSGVRLADGSYEFRGDYLGYGNPSGTQYLFGWTFSTAPDGRVVWNGNTGWAGGHIWHVTISDITCVPAPTLFQVEATRSDSTLTLSWHAVFAPELVMLEQSTDAPLTEWSPVTTPAVLTGEQYSITLDLDAARAFFRLRRL